MFMKHYAPNRCEPSIEALNFGGRAEVRAELNGEVKFCENSKKKKWGGGGGGGGGGRVGWGVGSEWM